MDQDVVIWDLDDLSRGREKGIVGLWKIPESLVGEWLECGGSGVVVVVIFIMVVKEP